MKPEPLKGKVIKIDGYKNAVPLDIRLFFDKEDIRSAVEWQRLEDKKALKEYTSHKISFDEFLKKLAENRIEAFEDVVIIKGRRRL